MKRHKWQWDEGSNEGMFTSNWHQTCSVCGAKRNYNILDKRWNVGHIREGNIELGNESIPKRIDKPWCD